VETKTFMRGEHGAAGHVFVTVADGPVLPIGAPSDLFARVVRRVGESIQKVGNMAAPPLVIAAQAGASMTVVLGDQVADETQTKLPYFATHRAAEQISRLMTVSSHDELLSRAVRLGQGADGYVRLLDLVQAEGITLRWLPQGNQQTTLDVRVAEWQSASLSIPPPMHVRDVTVEGLLYRVIYDGPGMGRAGIRRSQDAPRLSWCPGRTVYVRWESPKVEHAILHELIGQPVRAVVSVAEPLAAWHATKVPTPVVESIELGHVPLSLLDLEDDDEDYEP
jgi:hypothetical protein